MPNWTDRYLAGECREVWREMTQAGPALRDDPTRWGDAEEVARETVRRARSNIAQIHELLTAEGYQFARGENALRPPAPDVHEQLSEIEHAIGEIPLSLKVWLEDVGSVDLTGSHPSWEFEYTDPLVVDCQLDEVVEEHRDREETGWYATAGTTLFPLSLSPDYMHKADVSGGPPYFVGLPNRSVDALWENDTLHPQTLFVDYLRSALLEWGGFPGWARREPDFARPNQPFPEALRRLAADLERF